MTKKITSALFAAMVAICLVVSPAASDDGGLYPSDLRQSGASYDFTGFEAQLDDYMAAYRDPAFPYDPADVRGYFSYQPGEAYDLYGSADFAYLLWVSGQMEERTTLEGRAEWAGIIQSFQDPETGWFSKGNETLHFKSHATAYATGALALLDHKPLYPFKWKDPMTRDEKALDRWLRQIWWDVVWVGSHEGGGVAASLLMTGEASDEWFDWYLNWLDKEVNPNTGLWQRAFYNVVYKKPTMNDMGGAAHFWWIYQAKSRPMPYPERVIDSCLGLQLDNGLWDRKPKKGDFPYCINCDAINGINWSYYQLQEKGVEYREEDVRRAYADFFATCQRVLTKPGNVLELYDNSHDLPGAIIGIAEADQYFRRVDGETRLITTHIWRSALEKICWL